MAIYLSAGMIRELSRCLIEGGYKKTTPAALVYKATWDEEEAYLCTIETLYDVSVEHGITKTALILVGDAIAHQHYRKSRLYASDFSTEYRKRKDGVLHESNMIKNTIKLSIISFTENGKQLSERIEKLFGKELEVGLYTKSETSSSSGAHSRILFVETSVKDWTKERMQEKNALLFIGACGIAVRAAAPFLTDKLHDVPVLVMDEKGKYIIPVLSGHMGGANDLADYIAEKTGAEPVITTATDINQKFAVDLFAKRNNLCIANKDGIAKVSAKALAGEEITMSVETGHETVGGEKGIRFVPYPPVGFVDVVIASKDDVFDTSILLKPKEYVIGIGCKRGKNVNEIGSFISKTINEMGISVMQILALSSVSYKHDEQGIMEWCRKESVLFLTYTAEELQEVNGNFTESSFVREQVGVGNVCERAAVKACGEDGELILPKAVENGMTIAVARRKWKVCFDEK